MNFKRVENFLTDSEAGEAMAYRPGITGREIKNEHIRKVNSEANGWSVLCDLTKTEISSEIARFQGDSTVVPEVPPLFNAIADRIAESVNISKDHVFFQYLFVGPGGRVAKHYDAGMPGFVTYKCNVVLSGPEPDRLYVGDEVIALKNRELYCFEANLYKHWMDVSEHPRVALSYGFVLPLAELGWDADAPRVRLSNRIWRAFIHKLSP